MRTRVWRKSAFARTAREHTTGKPVDWNGPVNGGVESRLVPCLSGEAGWPGRHLEVREMALLMVVWELVVPCLSGWPGRHLEILSVAQDIWCLLDNLSNMLVAFNQIVALGGVPPAGNFITFRCACLLRESTRPHFNPQHWLFVIWACISLSSSLTRLPHSACFKDFGRPPPPLTLYAKRDRPQG